MRQRRLKNGNNTYFVDDKNNLIKHIYQTKYLKVVTEYQDKFCDLGHYDLILKNIDTKVNSLQDILNIHSKLISGRIQYTDMGALDMIDVWNDKCRYPIMLRKNGKVEHPNINAIIKYDFDINKIISIYGKDVIDYKNGKLINYNLPNEPFKKYISHTKKLLKALSIILLYLKNEGSNPREDVKKYIK